MPKQLTLCLILSIIITSVSGVWLMLVSSASAQTSESDPVKIEARVNGFIKQLTLDEKIKLLSGTTDEMHVPGIPRLGIRELKFSDGPVGVRVYGRSTAYPVGAMLAATWDIEAARQYGKALGRDCRARGVHVLLGPGVDLYRVAQCGRNFEYFGEDPYLSSRIAVGWIQGCQSQNVATSVKHLAANDQEIQRDSINTIVDERRLHEICLPPFKAAVQEGNAWTVMAAYNKLNGPWCTASSVLLTDILRKEWGFKGILMSDWGAVHDCLGPITAGTDLEMGRTVYYTPQNIKRLMKEGKVSQEQIDEHVRRILRMSVSMGFFDRDQEDKSIPLNDPNSAAVALKVAREGLVLLKNEKETLPLDRNDVRNIVVIGPNACPAVIGGGGSSQTEPFAQVSLLDAIVKAAGERIRVHYIPWWIGPNPTANSAFDCRCVFEPLEDGNRGVRAEYFASDDLSGVPVVTRTDFAINNFWGSSGPLEAVQPKTYSVRWTGKLKIPQTDNYIFSASTDGARILLDGKPLFDNWSGGARGIRNSAQTISLDGGTVHDLKIEYHHLNGPACMKFSWGRASKELNAEEKQQIMDADAVLVAIGFNPSLESEGFDRSFDLPADQVECIKTVAKLNVHNIVILNSGGNVGMSDWIDAVPALIHAWYPGQNGNQAVAEAVFGDINPSGCLPDSFEAKWSDSPAYGSYPGNPANGGTVKYTEGIYVGYRWFDKKNIEPRFAFGHGLSYSTFQLDNLKVPRSPAMLASEIGTKSDVNASDDPAVGSEVLVDVTNKGKRSGACVVQMYIRPLNSAIDRPVQELKGFSRVELQAGERRTIRLPLNKDSFALYDVKKHAWISPPGQYEIALGLSSRDIHCSDTINWQ